MNETLIDIERFSTMDVPEQERFNFWSDGGHCTYSLENHAGVSFDWNYAGATVGSLSVGEHTWLHGMHRPAFTATRDSARIRKDGLDVYQLTFHLSGELSLQSAAGSGLKQADELYLLDSSQPFDARIVAGDMLWLAIPRTDLPSEVEKLHGRSLVTGTGRLLADHIRSLVRNLPLLTTAEIPDVAQATMRLVNACVSTTPAALIEARQEIGTLLRQRVQCYIDAHLSSSELAPGRICKEIGISRAKLYQLFEHTGGIMRQIQRKRLERVRAILANPDRSRESIASIAERHGFVDVKYFNRVFKAAFGHTPGETLEAQFDRENGWTTRG
ncbi:helix-turn-helix domain-containing protein [Paraburkholderia acidicola]|uniref:Helix-turn-helix domain-containing protein n=1 Tax=Paraburkholderia acidicola TaxID=1912599 RepID=A0ABV1LSJ7_9BURK